MKIVTLTINPTIDINSKANRVIPERKLRCDLPSYEPGGGGLNVSRAIKKLGGESLALFSSGGTHGELLEKLIKKENIEYTAVPIKEMIRESITISEESSDQQYRFVMPGPALSEPEWKSFITGIKNLKEKPEFIVLSGSLPRNVPDNFYALIAKLGKELNVKVIVDTNKQPLCHAVEEGVYLIKPNMNEINDLTKKNIETEAEIIEFAEKMINRNKLNVIVVSLGAAGALLITKEEVKHIMSPTVPIKSKVGAGDSMTAGIVLSLSRGNNLFESVCFGVAAGASAVMTPGTELCNKDDTERLYKQLINYYKN